MSSRRNVREQFNPAAFRAKRCEETVSIRKQKREEGFLKRRLVMTGTGAGAPAAVGVSVSPMLAPQPDTALPPHILGAETLDSPVLDPAPGAGTTTATATAAAIAPAPVSGGVSFAQLAADLVSPSPDTQVAAVSTVRRILSTGLHTPTPFSCFLWHVCDLFWLTPGKPLFFCAPTERAPPIDAVIAAGCLPPIVELLKSTNSKLQFEACWALTNSLHSPHTHTPIFTSISLPLCVCTYVHCTCVSPQPRQLRVGAGATCGRWWRRVRCRC